MGREQLEEVLDGLFAKRLTSPGFLENCVSQLLQRAEQRDSDAEIERWTAEINVLRRKRERVIDGFVEGAIENLERDKRLVAIDEGIRVAQDALDREAASPPFWDSGKLIEVFAPLAEWEFWTRDQKRQVLASLVPEIRVADYRIDSLGLNPGLFSNEVTRTGRGSWPRPA
jgi:hypothetical protein